MKKRGFSESWDAAFSPRCLFGFLVLFSSHITWINQTNLSLSPPPSPLPPLPPPAAFPKRSLLINSLTSVFQSPKKTQNTKQKKKKCNGPGVIQISWPSHKRTLKLVCQKGHGQRCFLRELWLKQWEEMTYTSPYIKWGRGLKLKPTEICLFMRPLTTKYNNCL